MSSELANLVGSIRPVDDTDLDRTAAVYAVLHRIDVAGETPAGARAVLDALGLTEHARALQTRKTSTGGSQSPAEALPGVLPLADAENPRETAYGGRTGLSQATSTTEETR